MPRSKDLASCLGFCALFFFLLTDGYGAEYSQSVTFDPSQGISYNYSWAHVLSDLPADCDIVSVKIELRAKVWYWGWNIYEQDLDLLCSDSNEFNFSEGKICELTPATHPRPSNFYSITCELSPNQIDWVENDGRINFIINTYGGTYYLDYSKITVNANVSIQVIKGDIDNSGDVDLVDAMLAMKIAVGIPLGQTVHKGADINGDRDLGLAEAVYALQQAAGWRGK